MNDIIRLFYRINFPLIFLLVYFFGFCLILRRNQRQLEILKQQLQKKDIDVSEHLKLLEQYEKKHPLSQECSTLRLMMISDLVILQKKDDIDRYIRKIRAVDIHHSAVGNIILALLFLKEYGYQSEYKRLKVKFERKYKPLQNDLYQALIQENVTIDCFLKELPSNLPTVVKAIVDYYWGVDDRQKEDFDMAKKHFSDAAKAVPLLTALLNRNGYAT